ncbi:MAG: L-idonate 5-dehydrogenase [Burkholderiales bacterium]|nr:L-idonate 5-dehydrogenase [Burkholderiales bacterium]
MNLVNCRIHAKESLVLEPLAPLEPKPDEVLIRLGAGGICGSDLHYFLEGRVGNFVVREPLTPGHEASGVLEAVGSNAKGLAPGMKVAVNPSHPCGRCAACRGGRENLCERMFFLGSASVFPHAQGMFADRFILGSRQVIPVDTDISLGELAFAEPFAVGLHAVQRAGGNLTGKRVLVTGAGTIGALCATAAKLAGAAEVAVCDVLDRPLEVARQVGADLTFRSDQTDAGTYAGRFDVALEAAGHPRALTSCLDAVRRGGVIVQVGTLPHEGMQFPANLVMQREIDYRGAFRWGIEFDWAVDYLARRKVDVRPLLTRQYPLSQAAEAFRHAADKTRATKVQVVGAGSPVEF